jgi:hypothetical protein
MSKRDFTFLVVGAAAALGLACVPSPEAPEVPSEPTVAERIAATEEQIAAVEADIEYLKIEVNAARMRQTGLSVPPSWWDELPSWSDALESCYMMGYPGPRCSTEVRVFLFYCRNEDPQCRAAIEPLRAKRDELGELEATKFNLEVQQAKLELDQKMRERERE